MFQLPKHAINISLLILLSSFFEALNCYVDVTFSESDLILQNCKNKCKSVCSTDFEILGFTEGAIDGLPIFTFQKQNIDSFSKMTISFIVITKGINNDDWKDIELLQNMLPTTQAEQNSNKLCQSFRVKQVTYTLDSSNQINVRIQSKGAQYGIDQQSIVVQAVYCQDSKCDSCPTDEKVCLVCKENAQKNSDGVCQCNDGYYWNSSNKKCQKCDRKCKTCKYFADYCIDCIDSDSDTSKSFRDKNNSCACKPYFKENLQTGYCECQSTDNREVVGNECKCNQSSETGFFQLRKEQTCHQCVKYCKECDKIASNCIKCSNNRDPRYQCKCLCGYEEQPGSTDCVQLPKQSREEKNGQCVCKEHFYEQNIPNQTECGECLPKCKTCSNSTSCLTCQDNRDINTGCECSKGYFELNSICQKCDLKCLECSNYATNCTKCRGDRINSPFCTCPIYKYDFNGIELCQDCDISCETCEGSSPNQCKSCLSDRFLDSTNGASGRCLCNNGLYQQYMDRSCGKCSTQCATCKVSKHYCTACYHPGDILEYGNCYCGGGRDKIRQPDGSCSEPNFLQFEIYSIIDQLKFQNLIIVEFEENLVLSDTNKTKLKQLLQFQIGSPSMRNLQLDEDNNVLIEDTNEYEINEQNKNRLRNLNSQKIEIQFDEFTNNQIIYRVVSAESFSSLQLQVSMKNVEYIQSVSGRILAHKYIKKQWNLQLANQYNFNDNPSTTQQQLDVISGLKNMKFFRMFEYLYFYFLIMPGFQIISMIQILPIQLPPNLYNVCRMFSSLTFEQNQPWGLFNIIRSNTLYDNHISEPEEDQAVPENFRRLGFTSNFFSNCLEIVILILILIIITFSLYLIHLKSINPLSKMILYKHHIQSAFNLFHNLISYYIEATLFFLIIGFWLNLIYIQLLAVSIIAFLFGLATIVFLGYFFTYQMCLAEIQQNMIANRHFTNFLMVCFWYQKFFRIFRSAKKVLVLSFLVILNQWPIVQMSFIFTIFTAFLVLSSVIRPHMHTEDTYVLIINDSIQVILSAFLLTITIIYEKKISDSQIIGKEDIELYISLGWATISIIILFVLLNTFYQIYNLKRIFDFIFKEIRENSYNAKNNNSLINQADQSTYKRNSTNRNNQLDQGDIRDNVVQVGTKEYAQQQFNKLIEQKAEKGKKAYFEMLQLTPLQPGANKEQIYSYIKPNPGVNLRNSFLIKENKKGKQTGQINQNQINTQLNIYMQTQELGQQDKQQFQNIQQESLSNTLNNNNNGYQMMTQQNNIALSQQPQQTNNSEEALQNPHQQLNNKQTEQQTLETQEDQINNPYLKMPLLNQDNFNYNKNNNNNEHHYQFRSFENEKYQDDNYEPIFSNNNTPNQQQLLANHDMNLHEQEQIQQLSNQQIYEMYQKMKEKEYQQYQQQQKQQQQQVFLQNQKQQIEQEQLREQLFLLQQQNQNQHDSVELDQENKNHSQSPSEILFDNIQNSIDVSEQEINNMKREDEIGQESEDSIVQMNQPQPITFKHLEVIHENMQEQDSNYYSPDLFQQRISEFKKIQ